MQGWQANPKTHLCEASSIRAMPETEKPPAMRGDIYYFKKSSLIHSVATPFQIESVALDFDLVLGTDLKPAASILLRCYKQTLEEHLAF